MSAIDDLQKALQAGSLTGGTSLQVEDLQLTMSMVTYKDTLLKNLRWIKYGREYRPLVDLLHRLGVTDG